MLDLVSERVSRTGGITGSGAKVLLGAPHLRSLEMVIREAVQNSWDAATGQQVTFGVAGVAFDGRRRRELAHVLHGGVSGPKPLLDLGDAPVDALLLWDRGTTGLAGALQPDVVDLDEDESDFVRFFFMIGDTKQQTDEVAKGGTYGFGRSSMLAASRIGTILVHTRCKHQRKLESRFMGMTWTEVQRRRGPRFTGRHWWGVQDNDGVRPVLGDDADKLAGALGMLPESEGKTGTSILVLCPRWSADDDGARNEALREVKDGLLWTCWPRMLDGSLSLHVSWFDRGRIELPNPREHPRVRVFARALETIGDDRQRRPGVQTENVVCLRPQQVLGRLSLASSSFVAAGDGDADGDDGRPERASDRPLHHVALMRGTRLVVKYLETAEPTEGLQYGGVFLAEPEIDAVFARSEPPAHDDWVKERLEGHERRFVNLALRNVGKAAREFAAPAPDTAQSEEGADLGLLAETLGALLPLAPAEGASGGIATGGQRSGGSTDGLKHRGGIGATTGRGEGAASGREPWDVRLGTPSRDVIGEDLIRLTLPVFLEKGVGHLRPVQLRAVARVSVDGGAEGEPPQGAPIPRVVGWRVSGTLHEQPTFKGRLPGDSRVELIVDQPRDCSIILDVEAG